MQVTICSLQFLFDGGPSRRGATGFDIESPKHEFEAFELTRDDLPVEAGDLLTDELRGWIEGGVARRLNRLLLGLACGWGAAS